MKFVILGEALVDVVPDNVDADAAAPDTTAPDAAAAAAAAAAAGSTRDLPGGSPANVAVTLGRLGHRPTLVTALADDARGALVRGWLEASGVDVQASVPATGRTSTAAVVLGADGGASYEFDLDWSLPAEQAAAVEGADVVHAGSIATVLAPGADVVEAALRAARGHALVSFDPNARPAITPDVAAVRVRVERLVGLADVVKVSEEDLDWYHPGTDPVDTARAWATQGPAVVVVTLGGDGAVVVRGDTVVRVAGVKVEVADTIGAGDTFMGALLDALAGLGAHGPQARSVLEGLTPEQLAEAASWAARAAAVTVSRPGADPPTRAELAD
ncbi:Fructokinase [Xylanimonas cellulosilytica DSM 15894]|uniref:Fructokinase n=1 Tax=Xylanimonas cellulosilytica (strain DSM 15894 / JCM 12276 / CECT 5975 / KCTC 9989 / LMG 20990 / NBRC 107835 / XIL07) TaxID=446471 RepID=D1BUR8_XYLCX|nr:carbohydrate kinase [Xylanimonas cellulosilytica]ACZ29309.1 Fructokinase [Xylanimonas cellulosilytica DSM 15894]